MVIRHLLHGMSLQVLWSVVEKHVGGEFVSSSGLEGSMGFKRSSLYLSILWSDFGQQVMQNSSLKIGELQGTIFF